MSIVGGNRVFKLFPGHGSRLCSAVVCQLGWIVRYRIVQLPEIAASVIDAFAPLEVVGDEIFATFGAPVPIQDPEISSVNCAIKMIKKLEEINNDLVDILVERLTVGIGLNYGPVIAGNLGSADRLTYAIYSL